MKPAEAFSIKDEARFIDVRKQFEYEAGHVAGAIHITLQDVPDRFRELDLAVPVVVTCQIGQRSGHAAKFLREHGYEAHNLEGGLEAWTRAGLPLEDVDGGAGRVVEGWAEALEW